MPAYGLYGASLVGTPTEVFDWSDALRPGMRESTLPSQIQRALVYWNALLVSTHDAWQHYLATTAVAWLTAELARITNPPLHQANVTYPV